jgi:hypothetical protein
MRERADRDQVLAGEDTLLSDFLLPELPESPPEDLDSGLLVALPEEPLPEEPLSEEELEESDEPLLLVLLSLPLSVDTEALRLSVR